METKQSARELLAKAVELLNYGKVSEQKKFAAMIDAYLAAPSESAMEMVRKIRRTHSAMRGLEVFDISDTDAAALIEGCGRRVPRAMLYEINNLDDDFPQNIDPRMDEIAAKHGVVIE